MVKGVSRQVIVVQSPDPTMFEQAIFILRESRPEVTDAMLLEQAQRLIRENRGAKKVNPFVHGSMCALIGALMTGLVWFLTAIL